MWVGLDLADPEWTQTNLIILIFAYSLLDVFIWGRKRVVTLSSLKVAAIGHLCATVVFSVVAFIFGAALGDFSRTGLWGALMSSLSVFLPLLCFDSQDLQRIFIKLRTNTNFERIVLYASVGAILGAWVGAIPMPLDSDRPWQVWPVSCSYGATFGHALGLLVSGLLGIFCRIQKDLDEDHMD